MIDSSNTNNVAYFSEDKTFFTWANNGEIATNWSGTNTPATFYSLPRVWQAQLVKNGISSIQIQATDLPASLGNVYVLLDDDDDFTNGGVQVLPMVRNANSRLTNFTPSAKVTYFTIASRPVDTISPVITLSGNATMTIVQQRSFIDPGATWTDNYDGTGNINQASSGSVDISKPGTYLLEYRYTDHEGNKSNIVTRSVEVISSKIEGNLTYTPV
jgi:hypothetical protein